MASFTLDLIGAPLNMASEGGLDTTLVNFGDDSAQRTGYIETVDANGNRKMNVRIASQTHEWVVQSLTFTDVPQTLADLTNGNNVQGRSHNFIVGA